MGDVRRILRVGGHVAVDFVNTLGGRPENPDDEYLHGYEDLLTWTEQADLLAPVTAGRLRSTAATEPIAAATALHEARQLRGSLDGLLRANLGTHRPAAVQVQAAYLAAIAHATLQPDGVRLSWAWSDDGNDVNRPLWPIAVAAVDLLQAAPLHLLARCEHCRWLFLDTSRQHNRRWCSMNACGAIIKMRRYRNNQRSEPPAEARTQAP